MLRVLRLLSYAAVALALWLGALQLDLPRGLHIAALLAPVLVLVAFGIYCLAALGYGVATFRDCPEEAEALQQAWDAAKNNPPLAAWRAAIAGCLAELEALGMDKMRTKALEVDADKKVYGEAMRAKVLTLAARYDRLHSELQILSATADGLARAEQDKAEQEAAAQRVKADQEAAAKAAAEEAAASAAARAASERELAATEEAARQAERARAQQAAEQAAREEADRKAQAEAAAAAQRKEAAAAEEEAASKQKVQAAVPGQPSAGNAPPQPSQGGVSSGAQHSAAAAPTAAPAAPSASAAPPQQRRGPAGYVPSAEAAQHAPAWDEPPQQPGVVHIHHGSHEVDFFMQGPYHEGLTVVDFSASWCGPCRMMKPVLETLAQRFYGVATFLAMDCEATPENRAYASKQGVRAFPTFQIFHRGRSIEQFSGARPEGAFEAMLQAHIAKLGAKDQGMQDALLAALQSLKQHAQGQAFNKAYSTLLKFAGNLVDKPEERKFRCLRKAGAAFHEALGKLPGGYDALRAIGFCDATEPNGEEVFVAEHLRWDLPRLRQLLRDAQQGMTAAPPPQAPMQQPAPAASPELLAAIAGLPRPPAIGQAAGAGAAAPGQAAPALSQEQIAAIAQQMMLHLARGQPGSSAPAGSSAAAEAPAAASGSGSGEHEEEVDGETLEALRRSMEEGED